MGADPPLALFDRLYSVILIAEISPLSIGFILILLLLGSALISAAEVAYFSLSPKDTEALQKEESPINKTILQLKEKPRKLLATILISNNFINIAIVILSEILLKTLVSESVFIAWAEGLQNIGLLQFMEATRLGGFLSFSITVVGVTFLLVLFGEVAPKIYANLNNVRHAKLMAKPLSLMLSLFSPFSMMLVSWSRKIEERVYHNRLKAGSSMDKNDIDKAIELTVQHEANQEEVDILKGIIKFGDVTAKQIMKSRVDVVAIDITDNYKEVLTIVKDSGFSRIPVYEEDFDKIRGVLYAKDLLGHAQEAADFDWVPFVRTQALFVPETKKIVDLLKEFQAKRTHMAIVVDEYGGSSGLVTLEDIMEEVVGDIRDEFDSEEEVEYIKIDDSNYIFEGKSLLNDVARIIGVRNDIFDEGKGTSDSIAGLILELEGQIPKKEKEIVYKDLKFKIVSVNERRIEKVNVSL